MGRSGAGSAAAVQPAGVCLPDTSAAVGPCAVCAAVRASADLPPLLTPTQEAALLFFMSSGQRRRRLASSFQQTRGPGAAPQVRSRGSVGCRFCSGKGCNLVQAATPLNPVEQVVAQAAAGYNLAAGRQQVKDVGSQGGCGSLPVVLQVCGRCRVSRI